MSSRVDLIAVQTPEEYREIAEACAAFSKESAFVRVDPDYTARQYARLLKEGKVGVFALRKDGRIVGGIGAAVTENIHDGVLTASELFWFVEPGHRGQGLVLFKAFEKWARMCGCRRLTMVHMVDSHPEILERFYLRKGYDLMEKRYVKEI